jgi:hypothetical protein
MSDKEQYVRKNLERSWRKNLERNELVKRNEKGMKEYINVLNLVLKLWRLSHILN